MVNNENMTEPSRSVGLLLWGTVLLVLGIVGIVMFTVGGKLVGGNETNGAWPALIIVASGVFTGLGLVMLIVAFVKRRALRHR